MENHCISICKYHLESPEGSYSDDNQADDHECPPYADDAQYFDIDISVPFPPADTTPTSSPKENQSQDEFAFNFFNHSANSANPNHCISPADNLFYQGQLLPLQLIPAPLQYDIDVKNIHAWLHSSSNVPARVRTHFPRLLKIATKLKIYLFGFRKLPKHGMELQSPSAEYTSTATGVGSPVPKQNRFLTVKFKLEEVPLVSLFNRDNFMNAKRDDNNHGFQKKPESVDDGDGQICQNMYRDKKQPKEIVGKYVKKVKPPYVQISQRSNDKIRSRDVGEAGFKNGVKNDRCQVSVRRDKQMPFTDFSGTLKMVYKYLGKGKQPPSVMQQLPNYYHSESTLMEVHSVIQEAIAHCKQSNYSHL